MFGFGRKKQRLNWTTPMADKANEAMAKRIHITQSWWASWMSRKTEKMTSRAKALVFFTYLIIMTAAGLYCILGGFGDQETTVHKSEHLRIPLIENRETKGMENGVPKIVLERIRAFRLKLDSMSTTVQGRIKVDSIMRSRPGLLDSIRRVEEMYLIKEQ
ncbi:hypothetical protein [Taibaiella chishuiensis]|uniref:Uncharacterized protein n=1 Tax=Taibaiella chishuiensis TaxID=1434707 RepID=A0A2P8D0P1_9BACT|nr:hypothetical protein [Taibaiella chishuiensis]PSK90778.1 hypothetical protein B0I18_107190 [Taibaiella chishuiensis]